MKERLLSGWSRLSAWLNDEPVGFAANAILLLKVLAFSLSWMCLFLWGVKNFRASASPAGWLSPANIDPYVQMLIGAFTEEFTWTFLPITLVILFSSKSNLKLLLGVTVPIAILAAADHIRFIEGVPYFWNVFFSFTMHLGLRIVFLLVFIKLSRDKLLFQLKGLFALTTVHFLYNVLSLQAIKLIFY